MLKVSAVNKIKHSINMDKVIGLIDLRCYVALSYFVLYSFLHYHYMHYIMMIHGA